MKHKWKVYIDIIPNMPVEQYEACSECGVDRDEESENEDCDGEKK